MEELEKALKIFKDELLKAGLVSNKFKCMNPGTFKEDTKNLTPDQHKDQEYAHRSAITAMGGVLKNARRMSEDSHQNGHPTFNDTISKFHADMEGHVETSTILAGMHKTAAKSK